MRLFLIDLVWAAAVLGTEFTCGHIWQDKSLLPAFPVLLREPSAALHVGLHLQSLSCTVPGVPSSNDEGGLGNGILEAAGPANTDRHTLPRDPSLFQVTKIHPSPVVATLDVDSSAQDTGETKGQQEPAAMEEPKAHSGNEELQINSHRSCPRVCLCPCEGEFSPQ